MKLIMNLTNLLFVIHCVFNACLKVILERVEVIHMRTLLIVSLSLSVRINSTLFL